MTTPFIRKIRPSGYRLTDQQCDELDSKFVVDDIRSPVITLGNAMWWQFWAHQCLDSVEIDGEMHNRYDGSDNGQGVYPARGRDHPILDKKTGLFRFSDQGLPRLDFADAPDVLPEMTADVHRANENPVLTAFHLMAARIHNKRVYEHRDYELARAETIATLNQITLNEALALLQMDEDEFFDIRVKDFHRSLEWNFAAARWAHPQMPSEVLGRPIFERVPSVNIPVRNLFTGSEMARGLNLGVSEAMTKMHHVGGEPSIIKRTIQRHNELELPDWDDLATAYRIEPFDIGGIKHCPIWPAILLEAQTYGTGYLGKLGRRVVADGLAGSLRWGSKINQGLWHPRWAGAPVATLDIIDYSVT